MRVFSRFALVLLAVVVASPLAAVDVYRADCPMSLVATNPPASNFNLSPRGAFRSGSQVFALRGQTITTYTVNDVGDLQVGREDFVGTMGARDVVGGTAFHNGFLYVSSEAGLEVFDLRSVRPGGVAPALSSRTANLHYRRLAASGNVLAGLYPVSDYPCRANGSTCFNTIDIYDITTPGTPVRVGTISAQGSSAGPLGFDDIKFHGSYLIATGPGGTFSYNLTTPAAPTLASSSTRRGTFLVSNGSSMIGVGDHDSVQIFTFSTATGTFTPAYYMTLSPLFSIDRANPIMFHPQGTFDEANARLIMMVDERDPATLQPYRTVGFDVFEFAIPNVDGSAPRVYESISFITGDELKSNPLAVGPYVYTVGEHTGLQVWGACNMMAGRIEIDSVTQLACGGTEIHGWVTGAQKVANVEVLLDNNSLGTVPVSGVPRHDISSRTPVFTWRATVNLDSTSRGEHVLRLIATDVLGNRRQIASQRMFFPGAPLNCTARRRISTIRY